MRTTQEARELRQAHGEIKSEQQSMRQKLDELAVSQIGDADETEKRTDAEPSDAPVLSDRQDQDGWSVRVEAYGRDYERVILQKGGRQYAEIVAHATGSGIERMKTDALRWWGEGVLVIQ